MISNWQIKKLGEVCRITYGKGLPTKELKESGFPVFGANGIIGFNDKYLYEEPQVLISCRGAYSGKINFSPPLCFVTNNSLILEINSSEDLDKRFLYYILHTVNKSKLVTGTAQPQVTINNAVELTFNLPPLETQQAIVSKIEELFSELDQGIADLKTAQAQLKVYRQSVLKHAFEGDWEIFNIKDVTVDIFAGGDKPKEYSEFKSEKHPYPIYANAVAKKGLYGFTDVARVKEECVTIAGRGSGTGHLELRTEPFLPIVRLIVVIPNKEIITSKYLYYFLKNLTIKIEGSAIPQLTIPSVKEYLISVPSLEEQHRIVQEIESRLSVADKMEESIQESLQKAEALRQSILKKAFSGELV